MRCPGKIAGTSQLAGPEAVGAVGLEAIPAVLFHVWHSLGPPNSGDFLLIETLRQMFIYFLRYLEIGAIQKECPH